MGFLLTGQTLFADIFTWIAFGGDVFTTLSPGEFGDGFLDIFLNLFGYLGRLATSVWQTNIYYTPSPEPRGC
jgi:hypothetical protein